MLSTTCNPQHIPRSPHYIVHYMLWFCCGWHVVDNMYLCCGEHVHQCCPQHIYVLHNIWYVVEHICRFSLCSPQHTPTTYNVLHNIHPQYMLVHMLWVYVVEYNQHMLWITYTVECNDFYRCREHNTSGTKKPPANTCVVVFMYGIIF